MIMISKNNNRKHTVYFFLYNKIAADSFVSCALLILVVGS